jgi:hypothetical protein
VITPTNPLSVTSSAIAIGTFVPARVTSSPTAWRLGRRNGELVLQAGSVWHEGPEAGIEWVDVPTVDLDELEPPNG